MSFFRKIIFNHEHQENIFHSEKIASILERLGIHQNDKISFLNGLIGAGGNLFPVSLIGNDHYIGRSILDRLQGSHGSPITDEQKNQILQLIQSGELFRDVGYTLSTIFKFVGNQGNFELLPIEDLIQNLPLATLADIRTLLAEIKNVSEGGTNPNPQLLNETLRSIYETPQISNAVETANLLFDNNHPSLRLALIIYARLHNVNLEEADIDEVRRTILNRDAPDLGGLLVYAKNNKERLLII